MSTTTTHQGQTVSRTALPPAPLSQRETVEDLLVQSARGIVPIRKSFVQQGRGKATKPGPLASFVTAHDARALDAYLFVHALASAEPWNCDYPAGMWVRALGLSSSAAPASARSAVSKVMKRLEDRNLVKRGRSGRHASVTLLREDGSGEPYEHPHRAGSDRWLQLPYAYWQEGHFLGLSLPAKAMLLVSLSLPDGFYLPSERADDWYGVSPDSADRGLRELRKAGILDSDQQWVKNQRSETGWTERWSYTLTGSFSSSARHIAAAVETKRKPKRDGSEAT
jgi:hypothetical protein